MKFFANKNTIAMIIASILVLTISSQMLLTPSANAHTPVWNIPSFAYISVVPSPVGVGQTAQVYLWVDIPMPSAALTNDIRRRGYQLTITKPDGTIQTQSWDIISDTTGIQFSSYTPDKIGTYTFKFNYTGQTYTWSGAYQNDIMASS